MVYGLGRTVYVHERCVDQERRRTNRAVLCEFILFKYRRIWGIRLPSPWKLIRVASVESTETAPIVSP